MRSIKLKGNSKQKGQAHGEAYRKEIGELTEIRKFLLSSYVRKDKLAELEKSCQFQVERLKDHPELYDEFIGIADGSKLSLIDLAILNNYTDIRDFFQSSSDHQGKFEGGCSLYSFRNNQKQSCGQTWDMHASATPYVLHIEDQLEDGRKLNILTLTGCLALTGVNSDSVAVMINNMHCLESNLGISGNRPGLIWPALVKLMLLENSAENALLKLQSNLPCSGHNYMICDKSRAINVETSAFDFDVTFNRSNDSLYFHTNHYVGRLKGTENLKRQSPTTLRRHQEIGEYFSTTEIASIDYVKIAEEVFSGLKTKSICIHPDPKNHHAAMTCGGLSLDLSEQKGIFFEGLYQDKEHLALEW